MYTSYTVYNELSLCTQSWGMSLPQTSAHLMKFYDSGGLERSPRKRKVGCLNPSFDRPISLKP